MRKIAWIFLLAMGSIGLMAQAPFPTPGQIDKFMRSKTLVVLEEGIFSTFNGVIKKAMQETWTLTPFEFIDYDTFKKKKKDPSYSFLILTETGFESDKSSVHYDFLNLILGDSVNNISRMPEFCSFPLSYTGIDDPIYPVMMPLILKFMQEHVREMTTLKNPRSLKKLRYYNHNIPHIRNFTLWIARKDLAPDIRSEKAISALYKHPVKLVTRDELMEQIADPAEPFVFLFKVGPEGTAKSGRVYKIILGSDGRIYYFNFHLLSEKLPDGLLRTDLKRIGKY